MRCPPSGCLKVHMLGSPFFIHNDIASYWLDSSRATTGNTHQKNCLQQLKKYMAKSLHIDLYWPFKWPTVWYSVPSILAIYGIYISPNEWPTNSIAFWQKIESLFRWNYWVSQILRKKTNFKETTKTYLWVAMGGPTIFITFFSVQTKKKIGDHLSIFHFI